MRTTIEPLSAAAQRKIGNWLLSHDTGNSSETMAAIALGASTRSGLHAPHDVSDFGRCYRLVKKVPEIRQSFPRLARKCPAFAGIVREWDELVVIYLRDLPKFGSKELYQRIKQLRGDR